eukprot:137207_1
MADVECALRRQFDDAYMHLLRCVSHFIASRSKCTLHRISDLVFYPDTATVLTTLFMTLLQDCFVSVNRLVKYHTFFQDNKRRNDNNEIVHEGRQINADYAIDKNMKWPKRGCVDITQLRLKYREQFDVVLDINQSIKIKHGTKIGVCGRTGSGKSSILVSIFRLFEPMASSQLTIDGLDFQKL